jgi:methionine-rich copper-binding protein CopC
MRSLARLIAALSILTIFTAGQASAHARLESASPSPDSTVSASPAEIRVWTTQELMLSGNGLAVWDADGNQVDNGDAHVDQADRDRRQLVVTVPTLADGTYTVTYNTLSADDGHTFEVSNPVTVLGSADAPAAAAAGAAADSPG